MTALGLLLTVFTACTTDGTGANTNGFTITASPNSVTVAQGENQNIAVTIARSGNFAGAIALVVDDVPAGMTANLAPSTIPGGFTSSVVTISATPNVAPGAYTLTLRGSGEGAESQTTDLIVNVTAAASPGFSLSLSPSSLSVQHGSQNTSAITITRTLGFAGTVDFSATGAPVGMTLSFSPASTSATSSTATVSVGAGVPANTYPITIRGNSAGTPERTAVLSVTVPPTGNTGLTTYRLCNAVFAATQDGNGAWLPAPITNNTVTFNLASGRGAIAYVVAPSTTTHTVTIVYGSYSELNNGGSFCQNAPPVQSNAGSVLNLLNPAERVDVALGSATASVFSFPSQDFVIHTVPRITLDVFAARQQIDLGSGTLRTIKGIIRRNQLLAPGGVLQPFNFEGAEAFTPVTRTLNINNTNGDPVAVNVTFRTNATSQGSALLPVSLDPASPDASRQYVGVPQPLANDLHLFNVVASPGAGSSRLVVAAHREALDRTVTLGPPMGTVMISSAGSTFNVRPRVRYTIQPEYNRAVAASFNQLVGSVNRTWQMTVLGGYLGSSSSLDITAPDLTGVTGWNTNWNIVVGEPLQWTVSATGGDLNGGNFDGGSFRSGVSMGSITPSPVN